MGVVALTLAFHILYYRIRPSKKRTPVEIHALGGNDLGSRNWSGNLASHILHLGGYVVYGFMVAGLAGTITLFGLSAVTVRDWSLRTGTDGIHCPEFPLTITYVSADFVGFTTRRLIHHKVVCFCVSVRCPPVKADKPPMHKIQYDHITFCPRGLCIQRSVSHGDVYKATSRQRRGPNPLRETGCPLFDGSGYSPIYSPDIYPCRSKGVFCWSCKECGTKWLEESHINAQPRANCILDF